MEARPASRGGRWRLRGRRRCGLPWRGRVRTAVTRARRRRVETGDEQGLEAEDQLEPEDEQDSDGRPLWEDVENSLVIARGDHECHDNGGGGGDRPSEYLNSQSDQAPHLRVRMRRRWVECRHDIDTFTSGLLSIYEFLKPSEEHKSKQNQLVDSLAKSVSKEWPNAQLHLYGSCANSFGTFHSDVDVCLEIEIGTGSAAEVLLTLAEILRTDNFENVEAITSARVPIVRMSDPGSRFSCDICFNNLFAVATAKLLKDYARIDERVLQLAFIVKHWAKLRGVNETYRGTLSSYAYVLLCINFLQLREPKIIPCLQAMEPTYTMVADDTECAYFDEVHQLHDFGAENKEKHRGVTLDILPLLGIPPRLQERSHLRPQGEGNQQAGEELDDSRWKRPSSDVH